MHIEVVDDSKGQAAPLNFPPVENYVDLRQNPHAIERIAPAREYLPLRNFLIAVNTPESAFASVTVDIESKSLGDESAGELYEFSSRTSLVFAAPSLNFDRNSYTELTKGLKELLGRDSGESVRGVFRILSCNFLPQDRSGFCLKIELAARGNSAKQAELRWGFGLARVQQALLFRARALAQQRDA